MSTIDLNKNEKSSEKHSSISLDISNESPLQVVADQRFHMIIARAMKRARVAPILLKENNRSERSSWSSASAVSTIDLRTPEPSLKEQLVEKLQTIDKKSRNRKLLFIMIIIIILLCIGIILSVTLTVVLNKSPSANNSTDTAVSVDNN